jgi:hypothetical protein
MVGIVIICVCMNYYCPVGCLPLLKSGFVKILIMFTFHTSGCTFCGIIDLLLQLGIGRRGIAQLSIVCYISALLRKIQQIRLIPLVAVNRRTTDKQESPCIPFNRITHQHCQWIFLVWYVMMMTLARRGTITSPSAERLLLLRCAPLSCRPVAPLLETSFDPAKSTNACVYYER